MKAIKIFVIVTFGALIGMVMGGLFGCFAGRLAPDFFQHFIPWRDVAPIGFATVCGATVGVLLGGGLGCFGIIIQTIMDLRKKTA